MLYTSDLVFYPGVREHYEDTKELYHIYQSYILNISIRLEKCLPLLSVSQRANTDSSREKTYSNSF